MTLTESRYFNVRYLGLTDENGIKLLNTKFRNYRDSNFYRSSKSVGNYNNNYNYNLCVPKMLERRSKDSSNIYYVLLDNLPSWKGFPSRSKSVCFTNSTDVADTYSGKLMKVVPIDNSRIAYGVYEEDFLKFPFASKRFIQSSIAGVSNIISRALLTFYSYCYPTTGATGFEILSRLSTIKSNEYQKFLNILEKASQLEEFKKWLELSKNGEFKLFIEDLETYKRGTWEEYFDDLLNPKKNKIGLLTNGKTFADGGDDDDDSKSFEFWTDSPCIVASQRSINTARISLSPNISPSPVVEKIYLKSLLPESVNSKGVFKAIFMSGIPGSGKSYVISQIKDGNIQPKIVNTDTFIEYISKTVGYDINSKNYDLFKDNVKKLTVNQLALYINAVLPLFVDGTSNSLKNLFRREGILKSFGYDTGMVWINTDLDVAIERASKRARHVPEDFIRQVHESLEKNKEYYQSHFKFFVEIENHSGELDDRVIKSAYTRCREFFNSPIQNPVGVENYNKLIKSSGNLVPTIYKDINSITNVVNGWYGNY